MYNCGDKGENVVGYIEQKKLLLKQILENTKAQTVAIKEDDLSTLDTLIIEREDIMKQIDRLDQESGDIISGMIPSQLQPMKDILIQITQLDRKNQDLMKREFEHIKAELRKIRIGRQQEQSYRNEYGLHIEEGLMFDTKGSN